MKVKSTESVVDLVEYGGLVRNLLKVGPLVFFLLCASFGCVLAPSTTRRRRGGVPTPRTGTASTAESQRQGATAVVVASRRGQKPTGGASDRRRQTAGRGRGARQTAGRQTPPCRERGRRARVQPPQQGVACVHVWCLAAMKSFFPFLPSIFFEVGRTAVASCVHREV